MPDPVSNPWSCNIWETDGAEDAVCPALVGAPNWGAPIVESAGPGFAPTTYDRYEALSADWPDIPPVIPSSLFITKGDATMAQEIRDFYGVAKLECYLWACYQMHRAKFATTTSTPTAATYYQTFVQGSEDRQTKFVEPTARIDAAERGTIDVDRTDAALRYIRSALRAGKPVLAGIRMWGFDKSPNPEGGAWTTNHFLVVVGMGADVLGQRLIAYDYLLPPGKTHSLYLSPLMRVDDVATFSTLSQVRETVEE